VRIPAGRGRVARPMLLGFRYQRSRRVNCVSAIIAAGIVPCGPSRFMDRPAIHVCEAFAQGRLPPRCRGPADHRGWKASEEGDRRSAGRGSSNNRQGFQPPRRLPHQPERGPECRHLEGGGKAAFGAHQCRISRLTNCMDGVIPLGKLGRGAGRRLAHLRQSTNLRVAKHPSMAGDGNLHPLVLYGRQTSAAQAERPSWGGPRDSRALRRLRWLPHRASTASASRSARPTWRVPILRDRPRRARCEIKTVFDPKWLLNPAKVFPLEGRNGLAQEAA